MPRNQHSRGHTINARIRHGARGARMAVDAGYIDRQDYQAREFLIETHRNKVVRIERWVDYDAIPYFRDKETREEALRNGGMNRVFYWHFPAELTPDQTHRFISQNPKLGRSCMNFYAEPSNRAWGNGRYRSGRHLDRRLNRTRRRVANRKLARDPDSDDTYTPARSWLN